jgi:hypothetical protein
MSQLTTGLLTWVRFLIGSASIGWEDVRVLYRYNIITTSLQHTSKQNKTKHGIKKRP